MIVWILIIVILALTIFFIARMSSLLQKLRQKNRQLIDLQAKMEEGLSSQRLFISNVSHELRTPLATVIGSLDLALQRERTVEQYQKTIETTLHDAWGMNKLIDGLLDLAKADYDPETINMESIRLDELLVDVRNSILRAHPEYTIEILYAQEDVEDDRFITVNGNVYLLRIAFANLISNNCKYSKNNTSVIQISYFEDLSIIMLSDNGIGMSKAEQNNLYTLFYRGEQAKQANTGYGIGMTLVQKIVNLHQGTLTVHSKENEGTTFIVEIEHL